MAFEYVAFAGFEWANGAEGPNSTVGNVYAASDGTAYHFGYYDLELSEAGAGKSDYFPMESFTYAEYTMITFYVKFDEMAPSPSTEFLRVYDLTFNNIHFTLNLKNNGDVSLADANLTERDSYSGLVADTWYRFHVYWKRHATAGNVRVWATAHYAADSSFLSRILEGENGNYEGGTVGPTYAQFNGQVGIAPVPGLVKIGAAAVFTGANTGENSLYLNEGIGRRQWGVPYYYSPDHETFTSDFGSDLNYGGPDSNWARMSDVPFNTTEYAGFVDAIASGRKRCDGTNFKGPYQGKKIDYQDRGEVLAASWAFRCRGGTVQAHYGKGDSSPAETKATSGLFTRRSGIQYFHKAVTDSLVPKPEDQESAIVGIMATIPDLRATMDSAVACVLYVPPWRKRIFNGTIVGPWKERVIVAG